MQVQFYRNKHRNQLRKLNSAQQFGIGTNCKPLLQFIWKLDLDNNAWNNGAKIMAKIDYILILKN